MAKNGATAMAGPRRNRSRLTDGRLMLPGVPSQSAWARLLRDMLDLMTDHCGGAISEAQRLSVRRIAVLETELRFVECKIAALRAADEEPPDALLDLYSRLSNTQRRHLEAIGWQRVPKDVTPPTIDEYLAHRRAREPGASLAEGAS